MYILRKGRDIASVLMIVSADAGMILAILLGLSALAQVVRAEADGPDFYRVTGVAVDDVLNVRAQPGAGETQLGVIPADGHCLRNLGCQGGLTYQEFSELSPAERDQRLKQNPRWCKVEYDGLTGWVAGRYLQEGSCDQ